MSSPAASSSGRWVLLVLFRCSVAMAVLTVLLVARRGTTTTTVMVDAFRGMPHLPPHPQQRPHPLCRQQLRHSPPGRRWRRRLHSRRKTTRSDTDDPELVVVDWECVLDALPYYVELGIYAARQVWPHLNALCNWDLDDDAWLHNKLYAISHVVPHPELYHQHGGGTTDTNLDDHGHRHQYHVGCEFAFATRLLLEEQAKDGNESTGKQGKYASKYHPRFAIAANNHANANARTCRPLTVGEITTNWNAFLRDSMLRQNRLHQQEDATATFQHLDTIIRDYLQSKQKLSGPPLRVFPQLRPTIKKTPTQLVIRIGHPYDAAMVAHSLATASVAHDGEDREPPAYYTDTPTLVRSLHSNRNSENNTIALWCPNEDTAEDDTITCLRTLLQQLVAAAPAAGTVNILKTSEATKLPSLIWIDNSWLRLRSLVPTFGDAMPGKQQRMEGIHKNASSITTSTVLRTNSAVCDVTEDIMFGTEKKTITTGRVCLSLYLAEWATLFTNVTRATTVIPLAPQSTKELADYTRANFTISSSATTTTTQFPTVKQNKRVRRATHTAKKDHRSKTRRRTTTPFARRPSPVPDTLPTAPVRVTTADLVQDLSSYQNAASQSPWTETLTWDDAANLLMPPPDSSSSSSRTHTQSSDTNEAFQ